jgi:hypothetical protein
LYSFWNVWANLHILGQPNSFLAISLDYQQGAYVLTHLSFDVGATRTTLTVDGGGGQAAIGLPTQRRYEVSPGR